MTFFLSRIIPILFIGLAIAVAARFAASSVYVAEMLSHFAFHLSLVALGFATLFIYQKKFIWWVVALIICGTSAYPWVPLWLPAPAVQKSAVFEDITIIQYNIYYHNPHAERFAQWINNLPSDIPQPDILVIQEVLFETAPLLTSLKKAYPYTIIEPESNARGMAIYSKLPILSSKRHLFSERAAFEPDSTNKYTVVTIQTSDQKIPIALTELHTSTPIVPETARQRNKELDIIADVVKEAAEPHKILVGDMNITPYSPYFIQLEEESGLRNAMHGFGLKNTWRPIFAPLIFGIPIDHLLVSKQIEVLDRTVGPDLGSDHLPVITRLRLYK